MIAAHKKPTRVEIAVAAMQGICANPTSIDAYAHDIAKAAIEVADALLAELEKPTE